MPLSDIFDFNFWIYDIFQKKIGSKLFFGCLPCDGKPHRKPSTCCKKVTNDMLECFKKSKCFKEDDSTPFSICMQSNDEDFIGQ